MEERKITGDRTGSGLIFHASVKADVSVGGLPFSLAYQYGGQDAAIRLSWSRQEDEILAIGQLEDAFEDSPMAFMIPEPIDQLGLQITGVTLSYYFRRMTFTFTVRSMHYGSLQIRLQKADRGMVIQFGLELQGKFYFRELPALGSMTDPSDYIGLTNFTVQAELKTGGDVKAGAVVRLRLAGEEQRIVIGDAGLIQMRYVRGDNGENSNEVYITLEDGQAAGYGEAEDQIKWLDIGKDMGPLRLSRIGFALGEGCAVVYVDAGIRMSILLLEFIGLYLSIPFRADASVDYGLQGLAVTMSNPPLTISGGLYLSEESGRQLYTGEVMIRFQKLGLTALCSYGELEGGTPSLFAFIMLEANLGGPPVFYVTAIAGGFGYNRAIRIPNKVEDVEKFPFVAAAMGQGSLRASMTPAEVLTVMNRDITLQDNQYFASLGARFTSFGIAESFALVNVEFGTYFRLSLLGRSRITLPVGAKEPIVYLEMGIKMVLAPDDGIFSIEGAVSNASYLLDRKCKLQGGFAFCFWFGKREHAGDFVITLGGYRKGFFRPHYPEPDRIGVNWNITDHLNLSAEFYFALVPAGIMMGGQMNLTYELGRLKAWIRVWAEFFMKWKPLLYYVSVGVFAGVSYRWDFFPFYTTFKVELGADLELWGPPFGGRAHISWWVISFTIRFGQGKPVEETVGWDDFTGAFLHESDAEIHSGLLVEDIVKDGDESFRTVPADDKRLITIRAADGIIGTKGGCTLMDSDHLRIEVMTQMVCTSVRFGVQEVAGKEGLGIVPMKISSFSSILTARIVPVADRREEEQEFPVHCEALYQNVPRALWASSQPAPEDRDMTINDVPCGMAITCGFKEPEGILPGHGAYDMDILSRSGQLPPHGYDRVHPGVIEPVRYPQEEKWRQIEESIGRMGEMRQAVLNQMSQACGVFREEQLDVSGWMYALEELLYAEPVLGTIGACTGTAQTRPDMENIAGMETKSAKEAVRPGRVRAPRRYRV